MTTIVLNRDKDGQFITEMRAVIYGDNVSIEYWYVYDGEWMKDPEIGARITLDELQRIVEAAAGRDGK